MSLIYCLDMGPTGIDSKCDVVACVPGGERTPVINAFKLYLAKLLTPWLPNLDPIG